jgi:flavin-dependent dehydrogenase
VNFIHVDIVGGSFGGLSTALTIKRLDSTISITVYEKHNQIGYNPEGRRCAEGYPWYPDLPEWGPPDDCVFARIKSQEFVFGSTTYSPQINRTLLAPMIINRQRYLAYLGTIAKTLGVDIRTHETIRSISELDGTAIVDASGCPSMLRKDLGLAHGRVSRSYQQTIQNANVYRPDTVRFIFKNSLGYFWIFPRDPTKKEVNLGIGVLDISRGNPKELLLSFKQKLGVEGDVNYVTGGFIPVGLQRPLRYGPVLFVGDAGVGTFPLTGEGIARAILSGTIAAKCIVSQKPHRYPLLINQEFLRWDLIGKACLGTTSVLQRIGDHAFDIFTNSFFRFFVSPAFFPSSTP